MKASVRAHPGLGFQPDLVDIVKRGESAGGLGRQEGERWQGEQVEESPIGFGPICIFLRGLPGSEILQFLPAEGHHHQHAIAALIDNLGYICSSRHLILIIIGTLTDDVRWECHPCGGMCKSPVS